MISSRYSLYCGKCMSSPFLCSEFGRSTTDSSWMFHNRSSYKVRTHSCLFLLPFGGFQIQILTQTRVYGQRWVAHLWEMRLHRPGVSLQTYPGLFYKMVWACYSTYSIVGRGVLFALICHLLALDQLDACCTSVTARGCMEGSRGWSSIASDKAR